ncbi:MAG: hypothetical protein HGA71_09050 [Azonexaceae bacterium]|nr:hypothetical protein [Azonexaceae bacterium]
MQKKLLAALCLEALSTTSFAGGWSLDWTEKLKYYDPAEDKSQYYLLSNSKGPGFEETKIHSAKVPSNRNLCVRVYEKGGYFAGKTSKGYYINLSKINKVESLGNQNVAGESINVERYTLADGTAIETLKIDGGGESYACGMDQNGTFEIAPQKWWTYRITDNKKECLFDENKAKDLSLKYTSVFNTSTLATPKLYLGFNSTPRGYVETLDQSQAELKVKVDTCIEGIDKVNNFIKQQQEAKSNLTKEYTKLFGDPIVKEVDRVNAIFAKIRGNAQASPLGVDIGIANRSSISEIIGSKAKLVPPPVAEINGLYGCMRPNLLDVAGALTVQKESLNSFGIEKLTRMQFCFDSKSDVLHRMDMRLEPYVKKAVYDGLAEKYTLIEKTMSKGRTAEEAARISSLGRRPERAIEPYVDHALFGQGDTVIEYVFHDDDQIVMLYDGKVHVTYMTTKLYLDMNRSYAESKLKSDVEKWDRERKTEPKKNMF